MKDTRHFISGIGWITETEQNKELCDKLLNRKLNADSKEEPKAKRVANIKRVKVKNVAK